MRSVPSRWAGLAAVLLLAACSPGRSHDDAASDSAAQAELTFNLAPAFKAAFGADAPAPHAVPRPDGPVTMSFNPAFLVDLGAGRLALVSKGDGPDGGGAVAVHYLQQAANSDFRVTGQWFSLGPVAPAGQQAPEARLRQDLFDAPTLQVEASDRKMGCETSSASLYELTPAGPAARATGVITALNNIPMGAMRSGPQADYYGNILPDTKGRRFKAHYHGSAEGDAVYEPGGPGGLWSQPRPLKLPSC